MNASWYLSSPSDKRKTPWIFSYGSQWGATEKMLPVCVFWRIDMYVEGTLDLLELLILHPFLKPDDQQKEVANMAQKAIIRYFPVFEKVGGSEACEHGNSRLQNAPFLLRQSKSWALLGQPPRFWRPASCISTKPVYLGASPTLPESSMLSGKDTGSPVCAFSLLTYARCHPVQDTEEQKPPPSLLLSFHKHLCIRHPTW